MNGINTDDPTEQFNPLSCKEKELSASAVKDTLKKILKYLRSEEHKEFVYSDEWKRVHYTVFSLEEEEDEYSIPDNIENVLKNTVELACVMDDPEIEKTVDEIDRAGFFGSGEISIIKFRLLHGMEPLKEKIQILTNPVHGYLVYLCEVLKECNASDRYLKDISLKDMAESAVADSLIRSLASLPEDFEYLGETVCGDERFFVFAYTDETEPEKIMAAAVCPAVPHDSLLNVSFRTFCMLNNDKKDWRGLLTGCSFGKKIPGFHPVEG